MKRLCIKNLGPLKSVSIELGRFNLIIGKQSSGKSCVLKTACYCAWVEKYIQLAQSADSFVRSLGCIEPARLSPQRRIVPKAKRLQ